MKKLKLVLLFLVLLFPAGLIYAQNNSSAQNAVGKPRLNHIAVYVNNLQKSTDFYETVLNLKKISEPFHDGKHTWFNIEGSSNLHLIQGASKETEHDINDHLCFSIKSIKSMIGVLKDKGIAYRNWAGEPNAFTLRVDGVKQIYFQDPDGHWIEINDDYN
ncbi:VOC family protein [Rubrolithibacter danxiaensis]|uniref:VOC family protein n=1 Tax=Rubrolithibacter danxiaensis TaxID=3390805 RepID=UPI003BF7AEAE